MNVYAKFNFRRLFNMAFNSINSSISFIFFSQFLLGILQLKAFFSYTGQDYLDFSYSYLIGSVISIILSLNTENEILAGGWNSAIKKYFATMWFSGLLLSIYSISAGERIPHFLAFTFLLVSIRIFVAWANSAKPYLIALVFGGIAVLAATVLLPLTNLILVIFVVLGVAKISGVGARAYRIEQEGHALFGSLRAFIAYMPHTLSGIVIGNLDRYLALNFVDENVAEVYLRTLQLLAWSAFVSFPIIFAMRRRVIQIGQITKYVEVLIVFLLVLISLFFASFLITFAINFADYPIKLDIEFALLILIAVTFSQSYQIISILMFLEKKYSDINKITIFSSICSAITSIGLVLIYESALALAIGLLIGWGAQFMLTAAKLMRYRLRTRN